MILDYMRIINAAKQFGLKDDFEFIEFEDISLGEGVTEDSPQPDEIEIIASVKTNYNGKVPESYKTLNLIIGDWVEKHEDVLTDHINKALREHFAKNYPAVDVSEIGDDAGTLWLDQLDYMPRIDPGPKTMIIEIELVMDSEPLEDEIKE